MCVSSSSPEELTQLKAQLQTMKEVDEVIFNDDVYQQFLSWTRILREVGVGICVIFGAQLMLVLIVIMSMMVAGKRESIKIMSIIGATKGTIRAPFVIQGMWFGLWGSVLALAAMHGALLYFGPEAQSFFGEIEILPLPMEFALYQAGAGVGLAMLLGAVAAAVAAGRMARKR
jgi:cell division transport system permease protein